MNIVIMLAVAAFGLSLLWAVQSVALRFAGEPLALPLRFSTRKPLVRWTSRVMIHIQWLIILIGTPLALGIDPLEALHKAFPTPVPWRDITIAFSIMFFVPWFAYGLMLALGWTRIEPQHDPKIRRGKLIRRFFGSLPLATLEEAVFRGTLLEQLLRSLPQSKGGVTLAIVLSAAVFSAIHFVKLSPPNKPVWQPAFGLFTVGCLFGLAYVVGGRSLWLPIAMHAAAMFFTEVTRLYFVHQAPHWLVGYTEYPQSGLIGTIFVVCAGIALVMLI